jgi:hypothetical protein
MKRVAFLLALALVPAWAQSLSRQESEFAMSSLHASRKLFLDSISGLPADQWNFKPAPDRWSIAECAEHVVLTEDFLFNRAMQVLRTGVAPARRADLQMAQQVLQRMTDRSRKATAPKEIAPSGKWANAADLIRDFKQKRDRTIAYVESTQDDLRGHVTPGDNPTEAYAFLLMIAGHTERHVAQINEVKSDPKFPRK